MGGAALFLSLVFIFMCYSVGEIDGISAESFGTTFSFAAPPSPTLPVRAHCAQGTRVYPYLFAFNR
jgi:hypothetical protein